LLLIVAAIAASLATLALLASLLRSLRVDPAHSRKERSERQERRQGHFGERDAREAIALVGAALAATHNPRALVPLILEVVTEATGARGAQMLQGAEEAGWFGDIGRGIARPLRLGLGEAEEPMTLVLYPPRRGFDAETRRLAEWIAAQATVALENARLHEEARRQATTDELTGLVNRRRFMQALEAEVERARLFETPFAVVLADLDDFKRINDDHGHHAGDLALRSFGRLLADQIRDFDVGGRLGGEEFAVLLPQTNVTEAMAVAGRIRDALAAASIEVGDGATVRLTASFGVADSGSSASTDELLRRADNALYSAKRAGKDRYVVAAAVERG
jgi:diguanylate cyclase (GGDEF)-like protein